MTPWIDRTMEQEIQLYGIAFLRGSTANQYAANATNCFNRTLYTIYRQTLLLQWRLHYGSFEDQVYNATAFVSNATNSMMVCFDTLENFVYYSQQKY